MLWLIEPNAFGEFLRGLALRLKVAGAMTGEELHAFDAIDTFSGPVDDARRVGLPVARAGDVAIVAVSGPMMKGPAWLSFYGFAITPLIRAALKTAIADEEISQIVLAIDSPGGTVDGTAELADDVREAAKVKPVTAQSTGMIASAAYWLASQADNINAGRMDLIGSIGVRLMTYDFSEMFAEVGIRPVVIDTGKFKSAGAMGTEITEEQEAYFQHIVDGQFAEFQSAVMSGRGMDEKQFKAVSDGRVFMAAESLGLGLIDGVKTVEETLATFRRKAATARKARARLDLSRRTA